MTSLGATLPTRVRTALEDVTALSELHSDAAARARHDQVPTSEVAIKRVFRSGRHADALHRAIIEAGHRAVVVALHEVHRRPRREVSVARLLSRPVAARLANREVWQQLYCLAVYRNKIVAHHEMARMASSMTSADGVRRLVPLPEGWRIVKDDAARLREIRDQTGIGLGLDNDFELLEQLFYEVPVDFGFEVSSTRRDVDQMLEQGGVKSPSVPEIMSWVEGALDDLVKARLLSAVTDDGVAS